MKNRTIIVLVTVVLLLYIIVIFNFPKPVTALHINSDSIRLESDMSKALSITVKPEKAYSFQYKLVSENEFVAVCEGNSVYAVNEGETYIYATSADGKIISNKIQVIVSNHLFEIAAEIVLDGADYDKQIYPEDKVEQITKGTIAKEAVNTIKASDQAPDTPQSDSNDIVYVTVSGAKFHKSTCAYAKTASPVVRSEAVLEGKTPCKKCNP